MIEHSKQNQARSGFTLVELLVVIVIATIVLSIAIPRIRTINKERNLREAARTVGSVFANASQRALVDGVAGVRITRNANFEDAATTVSLLRGVPNYIGDQQNATISVSGNTVSIPRPLEQDTLNIVQDGDSISFGGSSIQYRVRVPNPDSNPLMLSLERGGRGSGINYMPLPADGSTFVIHRRPRVLRSSTADLPIGNIIDLRFSGFEADGGGQADFDDSSSIDVVFSEDGSIDQVFDTDDMGAVTQTIPLGPMYLMIAEAPLPDSPSPLTDPQTLWVAVSNNGSTNIGYNNTENNGDVAEARENSLTTSASQ